MNIEQHSEYTHFTADTGNALVVTVYHFEHGSFGEPPLAVVNWASIGSVSPAVAATYAELIAAAAEYAAQLNALVAV